MEQGRLLFYVILCVCAMGGFAVLLRISMERRRLMTRYNHIKKLLEYREQIRRRMEQKSQEVAESDEFIPPAAAQTQSIELPDDVEVATVQPVAE